MKKLLLVLVVAFCASCDIMQPIPPAPCDTVYLPAKISYSVPNVNHVFGEADRYNVLTFTDTTGAVGTLLFTDSSLADHVKRAIKKGY